MPYTYPVEEPENEQSDHRWMITFADLLSLILSFFVMLYAMSSLDIQRWEDIARSFNQRLKVQEISVVNLPTETLSMTKETMIKAANLDYLTSVIYDKFRDSGQLNTVFHIQKLSDRLVLSLTGKNVFVEESDTLMPEAQTIFRTVGVVLQTLPNHIEVPLPQI